MHILGKITKILLVLKTFYFEKDSLIEHFKLKSELVYLMLFFNNMKK